MPPQSFEPWGRITQIHPTHHPKSRGGSLTFQTEIPGTHPRVGEDHHHAPQDHPQVVEVVEVEAVEVVEAVEAVEEHSHCPDTHPPNQLKNF